MAFRKIERKSNPDSLEKYEVIYDQSGVVAFQWHQQQLRILLITNRKGTRWVIPKGLVEPELSPLQSAKKEAFEEAGIHGHAYPEPLGEYSYEKWGGLCIVKVFPLRVTELADTWTEALFRQREWVSPEEAIYRVREPELKEILKNFQTRATAFRGND